MGGHEPPEVRQGLRRRTLLGGTLLGGAAALATTGEAAAGTPARRRRVRLGVNYTPPTRWFHLWQDWREDDVRRDLADIAALGLDHIRIMLLWSEFQPEPRLFNGQLLDRLERFLDLAGTAGLDVELTVFNGHISARYWTPNWLQTEPKPKNWFTDPAALEAQREFLRVLARRVGGHRRFMGFDLSNEPYYYWDNFAGLDVTPAQADGWLNTLAGVAQEVAPGKANTVGCDSAPWDATGDRCFTRSALASAGAVSSIHPWTSFKQILKTDPLGPLATHNAERLVQVMQAYGAPDRPGWVQEDGAAPSIHFSDQTRPLLGEWLKRSVRNAASGAHVLGFTWWCSHDVSPSLVPNLNPLEYDLGLYTNDRRLKPAGKALRELAAEFDRHPPAVEPRTMGIVLPDDDPVRGRDLFFALAEQGTRAAFVLESRSHDQSYLRTRGITELVRP
ncbi:glycoside hydrolase 5 family protein [Amycolatopsis nigrescens]|uniref:glycoside hydrolase 5 family protein n=1 Tax=Amycolatopsis nigrescens TaxID=381445 RepID=UPI000374DFB7|nr:cellulase family glycosylhydrolase [Amycolatopsis nigrescens]